MTTFTYTKGQIAGYEAVKSGKHCMIIGTAGVGKSTLLEWIKKDFGHETVFFASTGAANINMFDGRGGGGTAHSGLSLPLDIQDPHWAKKLGKKTNILFASSGAVKRIVIDEGCMLDSATFDYIMTRIEKYNLPTKKRKARNIQLILVGDCLQLPSVVTDHKHPITGLSNREFLEKTYGSVKFFNSQRFKDLNFKVVVLDQVMRQDDAAFKAALKVIRYKFKDKLEACVDWINEQCYRPEETPEGIPVLATTNAIVDRMNYEDFQRNPNDSYCVEAEVEGVYDVDDKDLPAEREIFLKVGLQMMTLVNHKQGKYANGTLGVITDLNEEGVELELNGTKERIIVEEHVYENHKYVVNKENFLLINKVFIPVVGDFPEGIFSKDKLEVTNINGNVISLAITGEDSCDTIDVAINPETEDQLDVLEAGAKGIVYIKETLDMETVGKYSQYPLKQATARTGHKAQGSTITCEALVDFGYRDAFAPAQVYVMLSRFSDIKNIYLKRKLRVSDIKICEESMKWFLEQTNGRHI